MRKILSILLLAFIASNVNAAGFRVALQSAQQLGMGHVGAGLNLGAESVFFNPGALAFNAKGDISVSGAAVNPKTQYNSPGSSYSTTLESNVGTPFGAFGSFKINDDFAGGLGVYTPYGNTVEWPQDWAGQYVSQSIKLKAIFVQPTLSYQINDKLGIGAGFIYAFGDVELERGIPISVTPEPNVMLETEDAASGIGYNIGIYYEPSEEISMGLNYRSTVDMDAEDGKVSFENMPSYLASSFSATQFDASLPLVGEAAFGIGIKPTDRLTVAADLNYSFWSEYDKLTFLYDGVIGGSNTTVIPQEWSDSWTTKLGGEYAASEKLDVRLGGYLDFSPVPDNHLSPITPDSDRKSLTTGFTFKPSEQFNVDASLLFLDSDERTVQAGDNFYGFGQRYKAQVFIPSVGFNYNFK